MTMHWNPVRIARVSHAAPSKLYLPVIQSLVYNYNMANVEAEAAHSGSLLRWTRQILSVRKNHPAFGLGASKHVEADHASLWDCTRTLSEHNPRRRPGGRAGPPPGTGLPGPWAPPSRRRGVLPGGALGPFSSAGLSVSSFVRPLVAGWRSYGSVAFVSARVEVRGTPPGMLATQ